MGLISKLLNTGRNVRILNVIGDYNRKCLGCWI